MARKGKANKGIAGTLIGFLLAGTFLFAVVKGAGSPSDVLSSAQDDAPKVESWIRSIFGDGFKWPEGDGTSGSKSGTSSSGSFGGGVAVSTGTSKAQKQLDALKTGDAQKVAYNRDEWRHWSAAGSSCWNVREEVLYRQAVKRDVTLLDHNKNVTKDKSKACYITGGTWKDPYTGKTFTNPADLDIDHVIPLGYVAKHGGQKWDAKKKEKYANSLDDGHLLAVFSSANRQKSDKGPNDWKPQKAFQCDYAKNWISVSAKWNITVSTADKKALATMLKTC